MCSENRAYADVKRFEMYKEIKGLYLVCVAYLTYAALFGKPIRGSVYVTYFLCLISWGLLLFETYRIEIADDNSIRFKSIVRTIEIRPEDIISIAEGLRSDFITYRGGRIVLDPFTSNLPELKSILRDLNRAAQVEDTTLRCFSTQRGSLVAILQVLVILLILLAGLYYGLVGPLLGK